MSALVLAVPLVQAHIGLEPASAQAGAYQKLTFRVGHGCAGSATNGITVLLPEGVAGAKPMPKAGWAIATVEGALAAPLMVHGVVVSSVVRLVRWKGGPLADAQYDEFSLQIKVPDAGEKYYFQVSQVCDKGGAEWSAVPAAPGAVMKFPAPVLDVVPATGQVHPH